MAFILDLRTGAPAEEQVKYLKEQLELYLTGIEDEIEGSDAQDIDFDEIIDYVTEYIDEHGQTIDMQRITNTELEQGLT